MSCQVYFSGSLDLKPEATFNQILDLYNEHCSYQDPDPSLPLLTEGCIDDGEYGARIDVKPGFLEYNVDCITTCSFVDEFEAFLQGLQSLAARGWVSFEGQEQERVYYGPDPRAITLIKIEVAEDDLADAQRRLDELNAT